MNSQTSYQDPSTLPAPRQDLELGGSYQERLNIVIQNDCHNTEYRRNMIKYLAQQQEMLNTDEYFAQQQTRYRQGASQHQERSEMLDWMVENADQPVTKENVRSNAAVYLMTTFAFLALATIGYIKLQYSDEDHYHLM